MNKKTNRLLKQILTLKKIHIILICIAFILSVSIISAQRFFNTTLNNELAVTSSQLLTADLEIASTLPLDEVSLTSIFQSFPDHTIAKRQIFSSMAVFNQQLNPKLIELVAVTTNYPLKGDCLAHSKNGLVSISSLLRRHSDGLIISKALYSKYNPSVMSVKDI